VTHIHAPGSSTLAHFTNGSVLGYNTAISHSGGIFIQQNAHIYFNDSKILGNRATNGGAMYNSGMVTFHRCFSQYNNARLNGGFGFHTNANLVRASFAAYDSTFDSSFSEGTSGWMDAVSTGFQGDPPVPPCGSNAM